MQQMIVNGAFEMGTPACPIQSQILVTIPGGNENNGINVEPGGVYDVHGYTQVGDDVASIAKSCFGWAEGPGWGGWEGLGDPRGSQREGGGLDEVVKAWNPGGGGGPG